MKSLVVLPVLIVSIQTIALAITDPDEYDNPNVPMRSALKFFRLEGKAEKRGWNPNVLHDVSVKEGVERQEERMDDADKDEKITELMRQFPELVGMSIDLVNVGKRGFDPNGYTKYIKLFQGRTKNNCKERQAKKRKITSRINGTRRISFDGLLQKYLKFLADNRYVSFNIGKRGFNPKAFLGNKNRKTDKTNIDEHLYNNQISNDEEEMKKIERNEWVNHCFQFLADNRF